MLSSTHPDRSASFGEGSDNLQQEQEDLDDVDVEGQRGEDVLLRTDGVLPVSYQELSVICQELQTHTDALTAKE